MILPLYKEKPILRVIVLYFALPASTVFALTPSRDVSDFCNSSHVIVGQIKRADAQEECASNPVPSCACKAALVIAVEELAGRTNAANQYPPRFDLTKVKEVSVVAYYAQEAPTTLPLQACQIRWTSIVGQSRVMSLYIHPTSRRDGIATFGDPPYRAKIWRREQDTWVINFLNAPRTGPTYCPTKVQKDNP